MNDRPFIGLASDLEDGHGSRRGDGTPFLYVKTPYVDRIVEAGGIPFTLSPNVPEEVVDIQLEFLDGLLLLGSFLDVPSEMYGCAPHPKIGRVYPSKTRFEVQLIRKARERGIPFLGICNGMQVMNVAYGGTLCQDLMTERGVEHFVSNATQTCHGVVIEPGTRLHGMVGSTKARVNSSHHQSVLDPGPGLVVSAKADDGTIEGIEDPTRPFAVGVQWHPELIPDDAGSRRLFEALVSAARQNPVRAAKRTG